MSEDRSADRNHEASPLRRQRAAQDGDFARSLELAVALQTIGFAIVGYWAWRSIAERIHQLTFDSWQFQPTFSLSGSIVWSEAQTLGFSILWTIAPLLVGCWLLVWSSHWIQTGPVWLPQQSLPRPDRLSPSRAFNQLFSLSSLSYLVVGLPKFALIIATTAVSLWYQRNMILALPYQPFDHIPPQLTDVLIQTTFHIGIVLLISSSVDYWLRWLGFQQRIRMSDQELRDEVRMQDGDPIVNGQRKLVHSATRRNR